jgi:translation initiation factor IF-3
VGKFYRINQYIQAKEVRVIDESGKQVGIMPLPTALQKAREAGVDLVEVAAAAQPPVCKIIDFKKFKYLEAKKEREEKKGQKGGGFKEVRFTPFIAQNDLNIRVERIKEFLKENNKVRVIVRFSGRQITKKEFGYKVINRALESLGDLAEKEGEPKFLGRDLFLTLTPKKPSGKKA